MMQRGVPSAALGSGHRHSVGHHALPLPSLGSLQVERRRPGGASRADGAAGADDGGDVAPRLPGVCAGGHQPPAGLRPGAAATVGQGRATPAVSSITQQRSFSVPTAQRSPASIQPALPLNRDAGLTGASRCRRPTPPRAPPSSPAPPPGPRWRRGSGELGMLRHVGGGGGGWQQAAVLLVAGPRWRRITPPIVCGGVGAGETNGVEMHVLGGRPHNVATACFFPL